MVNRDRGRYPLRPGGRGRITGGSMRGEDGLGARPDRTLAWSDPPTAMRLLTRLPVPGGAGDRGARAAWAYPLAGAVVGALAGAAGGAALLLGLPVAVAAGVALAVQIVVTGALHEDGLADSADGFWGGATRERRLEIMRDSRIGSFGALALILSAGLRWSMLAALPPLGLVLAPVAAGALSRAGMVGAMASLPQARPGGLAASVGRPGPVTAALAGGVGLALAGLAVGPPAAFVAAVAVAGAAAAAAAAARAKLGGQTGDVLGAVQQAGEVAALGALAALA